MRVQSPLESPTQFNAVVCMGALTNNHGVRFPAAAQIMLPSSIGRITDFQSAETGSTPVGSTKLLASSLMVKHSPDKGKSGGSIPPLPTKQCCWGGSGYRTTLIRWFKLFRVQSAAPNLWTVSSVGRAGDS